MLFRMRFLIYLVKCDKKRGLSYVSRYLHKWFHRISRRIGELLQFSWKFEENNVEQLCRYFKEEHSIQSFEAWSEFDRGNNILRFVTGFIMVVNLNSVSFYLTNKIPPWSHHNELFFKSKPFARGHTPYHTVLDGRVLRLGEFISTNVR